MPMTKPGKFDSQGAWDGFRGEMWKEEINVRDFIQKNYTPHDLTVIQVIRDASNCFYFSGRSEKRYAKVFYFQ